LDEKPLNFIEELEKFVGQYNDRDRSLIKKTEYIWNLYNE